jgi:hypothetical protein
MRKVLLAVTVLLVACIQAARADVNTNAAPADEYFGPTKQSVLEIRNRLDDYDKQDVRAMLDPSVSMYLNHLQLAIRDWQSKYPRDPWLPSILAHLVREYWRAGQSSSEPGTAALADLRSSYPDAAITAQTVALVYGSNAAIARVSDDRPSYNAEENGGYGADEKNAYNGEGDSRVASALPSYAIADPPSAQSEVAPPPSEASPSDETPPEDPQLVYQAPPPEEDRNVDEAPAEVAPADQAPVDQAPVEQVVDRPAAPSTSDGSYDAARGYDPVHGYDATRGYDVTRGTHVSPNDDLTQGYNTASSSGAGPAGTPLQSPPR